MRHYNINKTLYRVRDFISWQKNKSLETSPSFQRRPVWNKISKSFLIDTVVRGLPVPIIFLREKIASPNSLEPIREVVDGQQRLRTIFSYVMPSLVDNFDSSADEFTVRKTHNSDLAGKKFSELSDKYKQLILDYEFSVHILPSDVDDREVLQIFARMNSTGVKLNKQEIRNAEYVGEFKESVYSSSFKQLYNWKNWGVFTDYNISRMYEVEFVSDLYRLILEGISAKDQKRLDSLYKEYEDVFAERQIVESRFEHVMETIETKFVDISDTCFKKPSYLYVLFSFIYDIMYGLNSDLKKKISAKKVDSKIWRKLVTTSDKVEIQQLSPLLLELSTGRRLNQDGFRKEFLKFLKNECK